MRRVIVIAVTGLGLAGCSSLNLDYFKSAPPTVQVQLESTPPGADARTSIGPGCKTPCSVTITAPDNGFSVSYSLPRFQLATVPVQVIRVSGDFLTPTSIKLEPNPVIAELQPAGPPPKHSQTMMRPKRPKKPKPAAAAPPPPAGSPFPAPAAAPPPPAR